jgi:DNA polymerase I-like protein with 3'-5' exonuclease and polymerase domains
MGRFRTTPAAYELLHNGTIALAEIEHNGVRVDKTYLEDALDRTATAIKGIEEELRADPIYKIWRRRYGDRTKLAAPDQLAGVVFGELGHKPKSMTAGGKRGKADEAAFEGVNLPFVKTYFRAQKLRKGRGTYLTGIQREMVRAPDGCWYVHPSYNLNTVATFRSSCQGPNWQNVPTRNPMLGEMVRRCYIPRPGFQLVEIDYSQIEVRISACYNHDPNLIRYIRDPSTDMHRDMAARLFFLKEGEVNKVSRHLAKNKMVFPQFYGDFYPRCARSLWEAIEFQDVRVGKDGPSIYDRLRENGIRELGECDPEQKTKSGTFERHVQEVEEWLWYTQFPVYTQWKKDWFAAYQRNGGFRTHTGFAVNGPHARNDVINYPIQCDAFQCLLWSLPRINNRLRRLRMRSRVIGEIHDCTVGDVHPDERDDYINLCREIMVEGVTRAWDWIVVPLEIEAEVCEPDASWFEKKVYTEKDGTWELKV